MDLYPDVRLGPGRPSLGAGTLPVFAGPVPAISALSPKMDYAIIRVGGKQYRVREGETLVVDRLKTDEGKTFTPELLLGGAGATVTAKVVSHERGPKIRIGKYRRRTGYKRHNGFRAAITRIQIESIAGGKAAAKPAPAKKADAPKVVEPKVEAPQVEPAAGLPEGYEGSTVAQIQAASASWSPAELAAALAYEQEHAKRKGALAALASAIEKGGEA
jgi:large subunit ribosomal protein L21